MNSITTVVTRSKLALLLLLFFTLSGCATSEDFHTFVVCYETPETKYVYDENNEFYIVSGNIAHKYQDRILYNAPAMIYKEIEKTYTLSQNMPGNYSCTVEDAYAYATELQKHGYTLSDYIYEPYMCTLFLDSENDHYRMLITHETTRIYVVTFDNTAAYPRFLSNA